MNVDIAEFPLRRAADVSPLAQRARILGVLTELPRRQRAALSKAVTEVCRAIVSSSRTAAVRYAVTQHGRRRLVSVTLQTDDSDGHVPNGKASHAETSIHRIGELVDHFRLRSWPGAGAVVEIGQVLSLEFNLPEPAEVGLWSTILESKSLEEALLVSQRQGRELALASAARGQYDLLKQELDADAGERETLALLSTVASKTDNAVIIMEADGGIVWVNEAFGRMTGYSAGEVVDRRLDELLFGPQTDADAVRDFAEAFRQGHALADDFLQYRTDGTSYWAELFLTPVHDEAGRVSRWIGIGNDVTRRRQAQETLQAAKEAAEAASRAKSEFLANMSHEIRTPMNAIIGMTELALTTALTEEQREYLSTVQSSAESLLQLLNDILDLSKIEAGRLEIDETQFNLADLLRETLRAMAVKAHAKGLELISHLPLDVPQDLMGDPVRLRQVLVNLVGNAIKFTAHGEVVVTVERQWQSDDEIALHFAVRDTGIGIPGDKLQKIFESFTQADASTTRQYGGTGLGLTITAELLRLMQGRIWVDSAVGRGSTFHASLRFKIAAESAAPVSKDDPNILHGKSVLVVDDNATNRRILQEMLTHWEMRPTLVASAESAVAQLENAEVFDLVLVDGVMPGTNGFQLAETIQQRPELNCPAIMMLSSADQSDSAARCRDLGIAAYLVKPVSASALFEAIRSVLSATAGELAERAAAVAEQPELAARSLTVLVADDHPTNRDLATRILQRRGHTCLHAADGDEVLKIISRERVDVALMDVQMPRRDGLQTTATIREQERLSGRHLPIIALTAHAMKGDREKCLAAGMDGYLAKPLRAKELVALVERIAAVTPQGELTEPVVEAIPSNTAKAFGAALERLDGDVELLKEQMEFFLTDAPELVQKIRTAIAETDGKQLQLFAHRLRGLVSSFDADEAVELALRLEFMGRDGKLEGATDLSDRLEGAIQSLIAAMRAFL